MKKFIAMLSAVVLCCSYSPVCVKAVETVENTMVTSENSPDLWERFLKYDLCILDYNSLTDDKKDLCRFIFETELNSPDTIVCERARRILAGYDVGRRVTLEDTENYYDFGDPAFLYNHVLPDTPYLYSVPDIKHIDYGVNYNEYWLDDTGNKKILSTGEVPDTGDTDFLDTYKYIEQDENGNIITRDDIKRYSIHFKIIEDDNFTYVVYPDDTLYVSSMKCSTAYPVVPEEVDGMKVVGIKSEAFAGHGDIIKLPDTIEYIEPLVFDGCRFLKDVNLPSNLKYLGAGAFLECQSLEDIIIDCPNLITVGSVFKYASVNNLFINIKSIPSCIISSFENIDNLNFGDNVVKMGTLCANSKFMKDLNYTIPETVKFITNDIFAIYNDYYSDDLIIPETVKVFGAYSIPASGKYEYNLISNDACIAVIDNKCYLSPNTVVSGHYGTEAHNYALSNNIRFSPLNDINYGDSNNDGEINIADAVSLQKYLFGIGNVGYEADLTKDGIIDSFDMILMRKIILDNQ